MGQKPGLWPWKKQMHSRNLRKIVRKTESITEGEGWRIRINKDILQGEVIVRFTKSLLLRWYGHVEWMPKQIAIATMEGTRVRGRPHKWWSNDEEEDLNTIGTKNRQAVTGDCQEWKKIILEAKVQTRL